MRVWAAEKTQPSEKAGMMMCQKVPLPELGSQPKETEKTIISNKPTQKLGRDKPKIEKLLPIVSGVIALFRKVEMGKGN